MELIAVFLILTVLAAIVAGSVVGTCSRAQTARLEGDANTSDRAADRLFN